MSLLFIKYLEISFECIQARVHRILMRGGGNIIAWRAKKIAPPLMFFIDSLPAEGRFTPSRGQISRGGKRTAAPPCVHPWVHYVSILNLYLWPHRCLLWFMVYIHGSCVSIVSLPEIQLTYGLSNELEWDLNWCRLLFRHDYLITM